MSLEVHSWLPGERSLVHSLPYLAEEEARRLGLSTVDLANNWEQEEEFNGGYGLGRISWKAAARADDSAKLVRRFYDWLGWDIRSEQEGRQCYAGKIWTLQLRLGHFLMERSLDHIANAIVYDYDGGDATVTAADSIARYGRIERYLDLSDLDATVAANRAQMELQQSAWPWPRPVEIFDEFASQAELHLVAQGYLQTAGWVHEPATSVNAGTAISTAVAAVIANDCPHLQAGIIESNTETIDQLPSGTPLQVLMELAALGGPASGGIRPAYRLFIDGWNTVHYVQYDNEPVAHFTGQGLAEDVAGNGAFTAHTAPLGVIRDDQNPISFTEPGSWFQRATDGLASMKLVKQGDRLPTYRGADIEDADLIGLRSAGRAEGLARSLAEQLQALAQG